MKTSELIARLIDLKAEHGDLPVVAMLGNYGDALAEIDDVTFENDKSEWPQGHFWLD